MNICAVDAITVPMVWLGGDEPPERFSGNPIDAQIYGLAVHMLAVFNAALVGVPLLAPQAGDNVGGLAEMRPGGVGDFHHGLLHFRRVSVAVPPAALAGEFLPCEIPDIVPECSRIAIRAIFRAIVLHVRAIRAIRLLFNSVCHSVLQRFFRFFTGDPIHGNPSEILLEFCRGLPGLFSPDAVHPAGVVSQVGQQALLLRNGHRYPLNRPGHPGQQDKQQGDDQDHRFCDISHW